jgi:hypothetical protein
MTRTEQLIFVDDLCQNIRLQLKEQIKNNKVPAEWDGHELRCLIADTFEAAAAPTTIRLAKRSKRAKDYRNVMLVTNFR